MELNPKMQSYWSLSRQNGHFGYIMAQCGKVWI